MNVIYYEIKNGEKPIYDFIKKMILTPRKEICDAKNKAQMTQKELSKKNSGCTWM